MGDLYALDFDGVLCDSCGESSLSAVKAAKVRWPGLFDGVDSITEDWIVDQMHIVRPVVETGYENVLLVRLLLEMRMPSIQKSSVAEGLTVAGILENWSKIKPVIMEEWSENRDALIGLFGKVRDEWMDKDLTTWIGANRFYPGVPDALKFASSRIYIVTTKQGRFADALLKELAGVTIPPERIYGLGTGPKVEVLKQLQKKPEHQGLTLHFVEDRLATLKNVIKEPELDGWNLYLVNLVDKMDMLEQVTGDTTLGKRGRKQQPSPGFTFSSSLTSVGN
ncbi:Ribosomal RNA small subunit methyltransferase G [Melia azedarach]|uniref:Ribosomal RNA small subunit methyltransferase G n=1 Tax=Melia azedarach TaxID=155640 RepID=A0ACC1YXN3_MELAZ|nr:Ribosomal RNA small subunit methyltransferase G [Melia azedarach]